MTMENVAVSTIERNENVAVSTIERDASDGEALACKPRKLRAKVTNHADLLPGIAGTSAGARRFRDDVGGIELCSEIKLGLLPSLACGPLGKRTLAIEIRRIHLSSKNIPPVGLPVFILVATW